MKCIDCKKILFIVSCILFLSAAQAQGAKKPARVLKTGETFSCKFEPEVSGIPNYLRIRASRNTDAAVRLMNKSNDSCYRYAFINAGESYDIKGVPEGKYYLKVGCGKEWVFEDSTKCAGHFKQNPIYEKMAKTLDFNVKRQKVPSYEFDLDVQKSGKEPSEVISAKEFQK